MPRKCSPLLASLLLALALLLPVTARLASADGPQAPPASGGAPVWLTLLGERAPLSSDHCAVPGVAPASPLLRTDPDPGACGVCPQCRSVASCEDKQPGTLCNNLGWTCQIVNGCALSNCCNCLQP